MTQQIPGKYLSPSDYELEENTPPTAQRYSDMVATPPGTIPERMVALERRMVSMEATLNSLVPVLKIQASWAKVSKQIVRTAPFWVPILGAQFPKVKGLLQALLDNIALFQ
jgi:hypothetical protein